VHKKKKRCFQKLENIKKKLWDTLVSKEEAIISKQSWPAYPQLEPNSVMDGVNVTTINYCKTKGSFKNKIEHIFLKI
jgi:hypothetical protein